MAAKQTAQNQQKPGKPTLAGQIEQRLHRDILQGTLPPGSKLNLDHLREQMGVSVSSLREAVTRLVSEGLVEVAPQRGYRVTPMSVENLDEVSALRTELEPYALRRSIANGGLEWEANVMGALYRLNHTYRVANDPESLESWEEANNNFHIALIERCDMPLLMGMHRTLMNMGDRYRRIYLRKVPLQRDVVAEHTAIAEAAVQHRADDAAELLTQHIRGSVENLRGLIVGTLPNDPES